MPGCTLSMIRCVLSLLLAHVQQTHGFSNLAHIRDQNASSAVLQAEAASSSKSSSHVLEAKKNLDGQLQKPTKTSTVYSSLPDNFNVVLRSFSVVAVAELFDKTWFVALICAPLTA